MNPNWARWVYASLAKHLKDAATAAGITSLVELVEDRSEEFMETPDRVEIRINGPFIREESKDYWRIEAFANTHITVQPGTPPYRLHEIGGVMQAALDSRIEVRRYGTGPDDDQGLLGCLSPNLLSPKDSVKLFHFGHVNETDRVQQAAVDCKYAMYLSGSE